MVRCFVMALYRICEGRILLLYNLDTFISLLLFLICLFVLVEEASVHYLVEVVSVNIVVFLILRENTGFFPLSLCVLCIFHRSLHPCWGSTCLGWWALLLLCMGICQELFIMFGMVTLFLCFHLFLVFWWWYLVGFSPVDFLN